MRAGIPLTVTMIASLVASSPAGAVFKHYNLYWTSIAEFNTQTPMLDAYPPAKHTTSTDIGIIDDTDNGAPVLKRLELTFEQAMTANLPGLVGFLFLSRRLTEGPRPGLSFTGTGDPSSTIAWGTITGWTITGGAYCHSSPAFVCSYSVGKDLATVVPALQSPFYDLGTWVFHGTGFTSQPWVHQVANPTAMAVGNQVWVVRGRLSASIVPAVSVLGVSLLCASLLLAGARLSRKR